MYAAIWAVIGCDFLVEVELCLRGRVVGFLEYGYRRIVAGLPLSELIMVDWIRERMYHEVSIARVTKLRRLCARFAARANSAGPCKHLDCNASIRLSAITVTQNSYRTKGPSSKKKGRYSGLLTWRDQKFNAELARVRTKIRPPTTTLSMLHTYPHQPSVESRASFLICLVG